MIKYLSFLILLIIINSGFSQAKVDLDRSVPLWMEYDSLTDQSSLKWIGDDNASLYYISEASPFFTLTPLDTLDGTETEYQIGQIERGKVHNYHIRKDISARGIISLGLEVTAVHQRGRCLIIIDDILVSPLAFEIVQMVSDISMDGWQIDTMHISQSEEVDTVKSRIVEWYDSNYELSQTLFLLGHIPVPYSGNSAHDGHTNHQGAWPADLYYGELNGNWTDFLVNNTSPSRAKNDNIPGDGKYDQTGNPSNLELEVGRVDFHDLPAFADDEIELTRKYLIKNHEFKAGNKEYPRRALIENNFGGFAEGFGQSGWRNFTTMFGGENVSTQNYDVLLETDKYLFSYACGAGSYTSCAGVGTTQNLWAAKDIKTVFTLSFGSYFGDWDSQNNFLRSALASGDVLTNGWAGRPVWQLYDMALGKHIGYSTKLTQDATGSYFNQSNSAKSAHIALMGDPTLRLHAMKMPKDLVTTFADGDVSLSWIESPHASSGYFIYRREADTDWELIAEFITDNTFVDSCLNENTTYFYIVKAVRLENSGSGSYYNTSLGIFNFAITGDNPFLNTYYADVDMDGFGNAFDVKRACTLPDGFVEDFLDCDDMNADINPDAEEIPNNGIDEDCDGVDLVVGVDELDGLEIKVYPNPAKDYIFIESNSSTDFLFKLYTAQGSILLSGIVNGSINIKNIQNGLYWIAINDRINNKQKVVSIYILK